MNNNVKIWNDVYQAGNFLSHPTEVFIRMVLEQERHEGFPGIVLDHGCGSGVNAEFLIRRGHKVHCTEISEAALETVSRRFRYKDLPAPETSLIVPDQSLASQISNFDHVVAWCSLLYNTPEVVQRNIAELIENMSPGACFICAFPTPNDLLAHSTETLPDGSRRLVQGHSGQMGIIVTLPETEDQFVGWCKGIEIRDIGKYSITLGGLHSEHMAIYGTKPV